MRAVVGCHHGYHDDVVLRDKVPLPLDSFKGCLTSTEVNQAAAEGVRRVCPDAVVVQIPVSDGGEGFLEHSGDTPVYLIAGRIADKDKLLNAGFARLECINPDGISLDEAMRKEVATRNIVETVSRLLKG